MQRTRIKGALFLLFIAVIIISMLLLTQHQAVFAAEMKSMSSGEAKLTGERKTPGTLPVNNDAAAKITIMNGNNGKVVTISDRAQIDRICNAVNNAVYYMYGSEWNAKQGGYGGFRYWTQIYDGNNKRVFAYMLGASPTEDGGNTYGMSDSDTEAFSNLLEECYEAGDKVPADQQGDTIQYDDVTPDSWYENAVRFVSTRGLMEGTGGKFSPDAPMSRGMFITALAKLERIELGGSEDEYAAAEWGIKNGLTDGSKLDGSITREQLVTMLYHYAQLRGRDTAAVGDISAFSDSGSVSAWAVDSMTWAVSKGLISGRTATSLVPQGVVTKAEGAALLKNYLMQI